MNPLLILAIITASGILLSSALVPFQTSEIYADESETNTDQGLSQKNVGSGDSINFNCGKNSIGDSASILCESLSTGTETGTGQPPIGGYIDSITVRNCVPDHSSSGVPMMNCEIIAPQLFTPGRASCIWTFTPYCQVTGPSHSVFFNCLFPSQGPEPQDLRCVFP